METHEIMVTLVHTSNMVWRYFISSWAAELAASWTGAFLGRGPLAFASLATLQYNIATDSGACYYPNSSQSYFYVISNRDDGVYWAST